MAKNNGLSFSRIADQSPDSGDRWIGSLFDAMLQGTLTTRAFETAVHSCWSSGHFLIRAESTAAWVDGLSRSGPGVDAGYARHMPDRGFRSRWLVGTPGQPGAILIQAPPEAERSGNLQALNRPPHQHDSGRIAIITRGRAVFHVIMGKRGEEFVLECPVEAGDTIFWPAWTPHTFDARDGFTLISAMANYVSPASDGFIFPIDRDLSNLPRLAWSDYQPR